MFEYLGGVSYMDGPKSAMVMLLFILIVVCIVELINSRSK